MDHPFRSAAVGGFNRQDVLSFLETQSKQTAQVQQELQTQLEEARGQLDSLRREREELQGQLEQVRRELETARQGRDSLSAQLEERTRELSASQNQHSQTARELEEARRELVELRGRLGALEPDAQAYVQLKERTAGVELEAHRRAQSIQAQAEEEVRRLRQRTDQWLQRLGREYDELRTQVETTISHAADQLDRAGRYLSRASDLMEEQNLSLESLSQTYAETDPERVAPPMPIPEEE